MKITTLLIISFIVQHSFAIPIILNKEEKKDEQQIAQLTKEQIEAKKKLKKKKNAGIVSIAEEKIQTKKIDNQSK